MPFPLVTVSLDLAHADPPSIAAPRAHRRARVLVLWAAVPVGVVEVSVRSGRIHHADALAALRKADPHALPREAVRRSLFTGIPGPLDLSAVWRFSEPSAATSPSLSVIVCTRDRPADLARCLASLAQLAPAPLEVLIVDNAPTTDATARLVRDEYPQFRYLCEPRPGLDRARNCGVLAARGAVLAFTDDDVVVDSRWVGAIAHAFAADPAIGLLTGLAEPLEQETDAQIFFERYGGFGRGCRRIYLQSWPDRSLPWTLVGAGQLGAGANMAARKEVFTRVGLFDPALDVGTGTLGAGDHDFFFRVLRAGFLCAYDPAVIVRHRHRRTLAELERLLFSYGHATRCLFEREALDFPTDRRAIRQLRRWWWKEWAFRRAWRSSFRPALVPLRLVRAEIKGFVRGAGVYRRTRAALVPHESPRPDPPHTAHNLPAHPRDRIGVFEIDIALPLVAMPQVRTFADVDLVVKWREQPLGHVRIANFFQPLSIRRLADEIAHTLWHRILDPTRSDISAPFVLLHEAFRQRIARAFRDEPLPSHLEATIVVTTCNRPESLERCLESLGALKTSRPLQIVVVDNRPDSNATAAVVARFPGVERVCEARVGSSWARNAGIDAARGEIVAMVDDDMRVSPEWLECLLAPFARDDVMAVTGNTLPARLETPAERLLELYGGFGRGSVKRDFDSTWFHGARRRAVATWRIGGSGNAAFRRSVFREVPLFDVTLGAGVPTGVGEDTKLFYDILHAGYTIVYEPAATAWHYHRVTMPALRRQLYAYSKGHVAYHLRTFEDHRDGRALVRIFVELPLAFLSRASERLRGRSAYPLRLLALEFLGTLAGPWSLWRARRLAARTSERSVSGASSSPSAPSRARILEVPS